MVAAAVLLIPSATQADFLYVTNRGTITITGYYGTGGAVTWKYYCPLPKKALPTLKEFSEFEGLGAHGNPAAMRNG